MLCALFEAAVLPQLSILLVILLAAQFLGFSEGANYGAFFGGILLDLLTGGRFGLSSLILLLLSGLTGLVQRFVAGSLPVSLILTFVLSIVFRAVQAVPVFNLTALCRGAFLDVLAMVLIYPTLRYLEKSIFGRRELKVGL